MKKNKFKVTDMAMSDKSNYADRQSPNIFINYLPHEFTKKELVQLFSPFGKIQSAKVMIDLKTGISKGYGFIRFDSIYSAHQAILAINGLKIPKYNKILLVKFAGSQMENIGKITNSIYVKSLCLYFTIKDIWNIFAKYGEIKGIDLITSEKTKKFNGNAIITYSSTYEAQEAIRIMNNVKLTSDSWPLFIQYSQKSAENIIFDSDASSFLNGIKIVKPKNKLADGSIKNDNLTNYKCQSCSSSCKNQLPNENMASCDRPSENNYNDFDEIRRNENFMFSLIAEEL